MTVHAKGQYVTQIFEMPERGHASAALSKQVTHEWAHSSSLFKFNMNEHQSLIAGGRQSPLSQPGNGAWYHPGWQDRRSAMQFDSNACLPPSTTSQMSISVFQSRISFLTRI